MADTVVEVPPKAVGQVPTSISMPEAALPTFLTPHADERKVMMPDDTLIKSFPGAGADSIIENETLTHPGPVIPAQVNELGTNLQYAESPDISPSPKEQADLKIVMDILNNAKANKSSPPSATHNFPISEEITTIPDHPPATVAKQQKKTAIWKPWTTEQLDAFIKKLGLGARTVWQKITAIPKAIVHSIKHYITKNE